MRIEANAKEKLEFYIALRGCYSPEEYIRFSKIIESNGFSRIYVYDDLMFYPSFPILSLIAEHTSKVKVGPCLVNGIYRHPAIIASSIAFLDAVSHGRSILGLGRGAFFDFLKMNTGEKYTRKAFEETLMVIKHLFKQKKQGFRGEMFQTSSKAILRVAPPQKPYMVTATWNSEMAYIAGKHADELQIAEVFSDTIVSNITKSFLKGSKDSGKDVKPVSIGGMICVADDEAKATEKAKQTLAIYIPYIKTILRQNNIDVNSPLIKKIDYESKHGNYLEASSLIPDHYVSILTMAGTPTDVANRLKLLMRDKPIQGILFSPPYSIFDNTEDNINYISKNLIPKLSE